MKQKIILFVFAMLSTLTASAHDIEVNGIFYNVLVTAEVTYYNDEYGMQMTGIYAGDIIIPETITHEGETYYVTSIGNQAFKDCIYLRSVTIPSSVTEIGDDAFNNCPALTSITFPDDVTRIANRTFYGCSGLTSLTITDGITSIGDSAFEGCTGLTSLTIPDNVTEIGDCAFKGCKNIETVTIGSGVKSIGNSGFEMCPGLLELYCYPKKGPAIGDDVFKNAGIPFVTLYVPSASMKGYMALAPWNEFGEIKALEDIDPTPSHEYMRGDVNLDGEIGMPDVMFIVNYILNGKFPDEE